MIESRTHNKVKTAVYQKEKEGNHLCGDSFMMIETDDYFLCAVADGLGSGEYAFKSSDIAMEILRTHHEWTVPDLMDECNRHLCGERGTVITILKIVFDEKKVIYGNIGNIGSFIAADEQKAHRPLPAPGFLSGRKFHYRLEHYYYKKNLHFILHSDGISISQEEYNWMIDLQSTDVSMRYLAEKSQKTKDDRTVLIGSLYES